MNIFINKRFLLPILLCSCMCIGQMVAMGQNLNSPNKTGPLGTQVNTLTGNLFVERTDMFIPARGFSLDISFAYNSYNYIEDVGFGKGWTFNYSISYKIDTSGARIVMMGDGREDIYDSISSSSFKTPTGFFSSFQQYEPNKYKLQELDGTLYLFDDYSHKKVTRMEEPNGNYLNFSYSNGLLTSLQNQDGQTITFTYNNGNRLAKVIDANTTPSREYNYVYDGYGNLKDVSDPLNQKNAYTYLVNGPMKTIADKNSNKVNIIYFSDYSTSEIVGCNKRLSFSYDTASNKTVVTDYLDEGNQVTTYTYNNSGDLFWLKEMKGNCCGYTVSYNYDENGNRIQTTDANGNVTTITYDAYGNPLTVSNALGEITSYTYSTDYYNITSVQQPNGFVYNLSYDSKGNLTQMQTPDNQLYSASYNAKGDIITSTDPKGNVFTYNYDAIGNPTTVTGPEGYNATLSFDARGNLLAYTDALGNSSSAEYDILNRLKIITDPLNDQVQFTYDANGNATSYKNENGETSLFNYDASDRLVKISDPMGNQVTMAYDAMDNVKVLRNALGNELKLSYDTRNRLTGFIDAENNSSSFAYDAQGNLTQATLKNGRQIAYTYDALNRLENITDETGSIASFAYDNNGNLISYTNGTGAVILGKYDNLNRLIQVTDPLGNITNYAYDKNNNVVSVQDRNGHTSTYTYDDMDRVKTFTDNNGFVITVNYDAAGNTASLIDQNGNATTYTYDNLNRRKKMTYPDGTFTENFYNNKGNLTSIRRTDASIVQYQYDTLNRITQKTLPDGQVYSYNYDALGRVLTAANSLGAVVFTYDNLNRVTSETFDGKTTAYLYDIAGRTQTTTYPDGSIVNKEFDTRNRLTKITKNGTTLAAYAYNNADQQTTKTFGNGVITNMQYDFANRLTNINTNNGSIQNTSFVYDKEFNKTQVIRNNYPALSEQFTYDNGYRLTNYKNGVIGGTISNNSSFTYDAVGNRLNKNTNGSSSAYTINNLNQITGISGAENIAFTYDSRGNTTFDGTFYKTYDGENRLVKDSSSISNVVTYGYDALNRRVIKTINGNTLKYTYSGIAQIEERDAADQLLNTTVFNNFLSPISNEKNGVSYYFHSNDLNSVEGISNAVGNIAELYQYDAFGQPNRFDSLGNNMAASVAGNRFGFTGQEYDSATASYRFFFRNYSPTTGVFAQRDLIEYEDGMGMYQYVGNNPANGVDILGLECNDQTTANPSISYTTTAGATITNTIVDSKIKSYHSNSTKNAKQAFEINDNRAARRQAQRAGDPNPADVKKAKYRKSGELQSQAKKGAKVGDSFGKGMNVLDNLIKGEAFASSLVDGQSNEQYTQEIQAGGELGLSLLGWTPIGAAFGTADFVVETVTGKGITTHTAESGQFWGDYFYNDSHERESEAYKHAVSQGKGEQWREAQKRMADRRKKWLEDKNKCPEKGTRKRRVPKYDNTTSVRILRSYDPNEIIGPDGVPGVQWVSVNDRLPYTILCENSAEATAPARVVRITTPIEPKQDFATFQLGNFGFNNQTFEIPPNTASYYQRLDCRDSMGLFVDIIAGYDQLNNIAFWEFTSIDPITLLPPEDPLKGFLFLQDSTQPNYGHGFVNFSIKPRQDAETLDTIAAKAEIIFDSNEIIPTNVHTNTIDAVAPQSQLLSAVAGSNLQVTLTWSGADDPTGSGIDFYTIYVSTDQVNYSIFKAQTQQTDTIFSLAPNTNYCFFVLATDRVGNTETLRPNQTQCVYVGGAVLPVTWLYFNGRNQGTDNLLSWATASEQNSKLFEIERSLTGIDFVKIGSLPSAGNSTNTRSYQYTDRNVDKLNSNAMYYRLKQINNNNEFAYSNIVRLSYQEQAAQKSIVYPNPTTGQINITISNQKLLGTWASVYDEAGRLVVRLQIKSQNQTINLSQYANGLYLIKMQNGEILKVLKQH